MAGLNAGMPNVILITIDSLRADHLGCYGYSQNTSPFIDSLASKGALFLQAISNGGGTPEAFPSIFASVLPPLHRGKFNVIKRSKTIVEILKDAGYQTAGFHSNPYLSRFFYYHKGFDVFDDGLQVASWPKQRVAIVPPSLRIIASRLTGMLPLIASKRSIYRAEELTNKAISWLRAHPNRFFLWLHYMDTHHPYMPPQKYLSQFCSGLLGRYRILALFAKLSKNPYRLSDYELQTLLDLYDASIKYVDNAIQLLLRELGEKLLETITIVTADHGENMGVHGWGHPGTVYDEVIRVPLIISGPGIGKGILVKDPVSLMDLAPTIVDILGIGKVEGFQGKSFLPAIKGEKLNPSSIISVGFNPQMKQRAISIRNENWKYIRTDTLNIAEKPVKEELYNLRDDPKETRNLIEKEREMKLKLESKLMHYFRRKEQDRVRSTIKQLKYLERMRGLKRNSTPL
ncbi:sulfatase-like hydrolase/transferase [Dehalococcoidia bacterium]|nr:sulfatase-like hydrolase/transferase [Dehalococcoidia bacterium]